MPEPGYGLDWQYHVVINYPVYIYNYLNGIQNNFPSNIYYRFEMEEWITDIVFSIIAILKGYYHIKTYIRQLSGKKVSALFYKGDNLPALYME